VLSVSGVIGQDLRLPRLTTVASFRIATVGTAVVTLLITVLTTGLAVAHAVELAFAVAASTFCPLLLLGIWWRGLTAAGALAGLVVGGGTSLAAVLTVMLGGEPDGAFGAVVAQPALCTVPLSFLTMVVVSVLSADRLPAHVARTMVRLHAPEAIDLDRGSYHPESARR